MMAFYIELNKVHNDKENFAYYVYKFSLPTEPVKNAAGKLRGASKLVNGKIRINKTTGEVDVVQLSEGDNGMYVQRAGLALMKHWKKGEFPEKTFWIS
jgi:hypothetical protein